MPVRLAALATRVPPHRFSQAEAKAFAEGLFDGHLDEVDRLMPLFDNAGIGHRYSARPLAWSLEGPGFAERNAASVQAAEELLAEAARAALARAGLAPDAIDAVVCVCSTGIATPSLDARVAERLGLRADVERTPIFGLGCAGGTSGLARAASLARGNPGSRVLFLVVELCTLTFRLADRSKANLVACALFGDGAAAAVLGTDLDGPALGAAGEHRWGGTLDVMGWTVEDDGLGVLFSIKIPEIARQKMRAATQTFLARHGLGFEAVDRFVCHPGGAKVVEALEEAFALPDGTLADARAVLRDYGNMSAATVLFVLARALKEPGWRRGLVTSMGPGFTGCFQLVER
ncbi:MAG TPA: type III polyketide synthase [Geminicoccaceae bacterium]